MWHSCSNYPLESHFVNKDPIHRIETFRGRDHVHYFRLSDPSQLDEELAQFLKEAYAVGRQEHL
jgi:hypothetical protein